MMNLVGFVNGHPQNAKVPGVHTAYESCWDAPTGQKIYFVYRFYIEFEYDPNKSAANKAKHSIDFEEAQALWQDVDRLEIPARFYDEDRFEIGW